MVQPPAGTVLDEPNRQLPLQLASAKDSQHLQTPRVHDRALAENSHQPPVEYSYYYISGLFVWLCSVPHGGCTVQAVHLLVSAHPVNGLVDLRLRLPEYEAR